MRIEHIAVWTDDIARLTGFYTKYFEANVGSRYRNPSKGFESCFLSFTSGTRLEVMGLTRESLKDEPPETRRIGLAHFAISVGSEQIVDKLTNSILDDGYEVLSAPRRTGDGYYESVVLDPDGNHVEITV